MVIMINDNNNNYIILIKIITIIRIRSYLHFVNSVQLCHCLFYNEVLVRCRQYIQEEQEQLCLKYIIPYLSLLLTSKVL